MLDQELGDALSRAGRGRFDGDSWEVDFRGNVEALSDHERLHRQLNELTSFGAVLDAVSRLAREEVDDGRFAKMFRKLVGRARTTHEVFATYASSYNNHGARAEAELTGNLEYLDYFRIGDQIIRTAPTLAFGNLVLFALARIAMNGPLPACVENGDFAELELNQFRAKHDPDHRFQVCRTWLTPEICAEVFAEAKAYFGAHKHWDLFIERREGELRPEDLIDFRTVGDRLEIVTGGIDSRFQTDVGNFTLDHLYFRMRDIGIDIYSLAQRREIEERIRNGVTVTSQRFYDDPENFEDLNRRRDMGRERLRLRQPLPTRVRAPLQIGNEDWALFRRVARDEGHCPVYLRSGQDFLDNHAVTETGDGIAIDRDRPICFLRKKRYLENGTIGLDVVVVGEPYRLLSINMHVEGLRMCMSGQMFTDAWADKVRPWLEYFAGPIDILIDTHPQRIVNCLAGGWEALAWKTCLVAGDNDDKLPFLTIFPVGVGELPEVALFRPASDTASTATVEAINPVPVGAFIQQIGVRIHGLTDGAQQGSWDIPDRLKHTLRRYVEEEALFRPHTPEEMSHVT